MGKTGPTQPFDIIGDLHGVESSYVAFGVDGALVYTRGSDIDALLWDITTSPSSPTAYWDKSEDSFAFHGVKVDSHLIFRPSALTNITAAGGITVTNPHMRIQGDGGPIDITANPQISAGKDGERLMVEGESNTDTVKLDNGTGLHLHNGSIILGKHDNISFYYDAAEAEWEEVARSVPSSEKSWSFDSPSGSTGTFYFGGFYDFASSDNDFNPAVTHGTANGAYGAHVFVVQAVGAGGGDTSVTVSGTSITDAGVRVGSDSEILVISDAGAAGDYTETDKKWIGQVTLTKTAGPDLLMNFGFAKYWDNNNNNFRVVGFEVTWLAGANDNNPNISVLHHRATGWTYNNGGPPTRPTAIANMQTDYNTEFQINDKEQGAWKRSNLAEDIDGGNGEGTIIEIVTTANKAFELGDLLLRVRPI